MLNAINLLYIEPNPADAAAMLGLLGQITEINLEIIYISTPSAIANHIPFKPKIALIEEGVLQQTAQLWQSADYPIIAIYDQREPLAATFPPSPAYVRLPKQEITPHLLQTTIRQAHDQHFLFANLSLNFDNYHNIFQETPTAIQIYNQDKELIEINRASCQLFGYSRPELLQRPLVKLLKSEDAAAVDRLFATLDQNETFVEKLQAIHKSGSILHLHVRATKILVADQIHYLIMIQDYTDQYFIQEHIELLLNAVEHTEGMIVITDIEGRITFVNPSVCNISGYSEEELIGRHVRILQAPTAEPGPFWELVTAVQNGQQWRGELENQRKNGQSYWANIIANPILSESGEVTHYMAIAHDITRQKNMQWSLEATNEQLILLNEIISLVNSSLNINDILEETCRVLALYFNVPQSSAGLIFAKKDVLEIVAEFVIEGRPPSIGMTFPVKGNKTLEKMRETRSPIVVENVPEAEILDLARENLAVRETVSMLLVPIFVNNELVGSIGVDSLEPRTFTAQELDLAQLIALTLSSAIQNSWLHQKVIDHNEQLEEIVAARTKEVHQTMQQTIAILENSSDAIVFTDLDGQIMRTNYAFHSLFEPQLEVVEALSLFSFLKSKSAKTVKQFIKRSEKTVTKKFDLVANTGYGRDVQVEVAVSIVRTDHLNGIIWNFRDNSQKKAAEQALRDALEKEKEVNQIKSRFISVASHEFRSPLASIQIAVSTLEEFSHKMSEAHRQKKYKNIYSQIHHLTQVVDEIMLAAKSESGQLPFAPEWLDLDHLIRTTIEQFQASSDNLEEIAYSAASSDIMIEGDPFLLSIVTSNLISNAIKYNAHNRPIQVHLNKNPETNQVSFEVVDEGIGIPEADQRRLFQPFFRGRNADHIKGTGLGLMVAKGVVDQHGGMIHVFSQEGEGSRFVVTLPVSQKAIST